MMTLTYGLIALGCFFLWRRQAQWSWILVMAALLVGVIIFAGDVDLSTKLGTQL